MCCRLVYLSPFTPKRHPLQSITHFCTFVSLHTLKKWFPPLAWYFASFSPSQNSVHGHRKELLPFKTPSRQISGTTKEYLLFFQFPCLSFFLSRSHAFLSLTFPPVFLFLSGIRRTKFLLPVRLLHLSHCRTTTIALRRLSRRPSYIAKKSLRSLLPGLVLTLSRVPTPYQPIRKKIEQPSPVCSPVPPPCADY